MTKKVLIACEYSGSVRDEFLKLGFDAHSCDLLPCESKYYTNPDRHHQGDILEVLNQDWDLMIAHPPCTHLAVSGARWFTEGKKPWSLQIESLEFVRKLLDADIKHIALENPVSVISTKIRKPDQIIQPFHYGDSVKKTTCLWLKNLPDLIPTDIVEPEMVLMKGNKKMSKFHYETFKLPPKERGHARSKTFEGIAKAMAKQWGDYITQNNGEKMMKNVYNNVAISRITFYKFDDEGNELENEDGTIKEFKLKPVRFKPIEYLCEDLDPEYLVEIKGEEK